MSGLAGAARFAGAFARRGDVAIPGLIPYFTAGYPALNDTAGLLGVAQAAGCVAAEVGIPFSDPLADGPTIQRTGQQALSNGMTLARALDQVGVARSQGVSMPLALMTYINPVLAMGLDAFVTRSVSAGIDGVIVPDLPHDEAEEVRDALRASDVALIPLVAPTTTPERLARICADATGFVYCVSVAGVTGSRATVAPEAMKLLESVGRHTLLPRALGFGLSSNAQLRVLAGHAEAAVVGSALLDAIGHDPQDPCAAADRFLRSMLGHPALAR